MSSEAWLVLLVVALYLQDATAMLRSDEAVLARNVWGRWTCSFGAQRWKLGGREPCLPSVLAPHRAVFRLGWHIEGEAAAASTQPGGELVVPAAVTRLGAFAWVAAVALFVALPLGLFTRLGTPWVIASVVLLYVNNLCALTLAYRWRARLGVDGRAVLKLAAECLACAPYSVNLVRRLCALMAVNEDVVHAAERLLPADALANLRAQCLSRIDEQIEAEPQHSARMRALEAARGRFAPEAET